MAAISLDDLWEIDGSVDSFGVKKTQRSEVSAAIQCFLGGAVKLCVELQTASSSCISAMRSGAIMLHPLHSQSASFLHSSTSKKTARFSLHRNLREMSVIFGKVLFYLTGANKPIVAGWLLPIIATLLA